MADEEPKPPHTSKIADAADAISGAADKIARFSPQQMIQLIAIIVLTFICGLFGYQSWRDGEERKAQRQEIKEAMQAQLREYNAQTELLRQHCAAENEKTRRDANEQVKSVLNAFLAEGDRNRVHQSNENEKFRREVMAALKSGPIGP